MKRSDLSDQTAKSLPDSAEWQLKTFCREETVALGHCLGALLPRETIVCLDGDLGAGKTALTTGLAEGIGCQGLVSSPTFTLLMEHRPGPGGLALYHFDVYRLESADDFLDLGFDEYLTGDGICVIEWSERIRSILPASCLMIDLALSSPDHPDERTLSIRWPQHQELIERMRRCLQEASPC